MTNLSELLPSGGGAKEFDAVASGTLASGQTVALKTDGTVEAVFEATEGLGAQTTFLAAVADNFTCVYDSTADRFVLIYRTNSDFYYYGVVGERSGSTLTFGTPQAVNTSNQNNEARAVYDPTANRVLVFQNNGNGCTVTPATVTANSNSISFATGQTFLSGVGCTPKAVCYDPVHLKTFLLWRNGSVSNYGYGSVFNASNPSAISIDSNVGTDVTGNNSMDTSRGADCAFDTQRNRIAIVYQSPLHAWLRISSLTISSGSPSVGNSLNIDNNYYWNECHLAFDSSINRFLVIARSTTNVGYGWVAEMDASGNMTATSALTTFPNSGTNNQGQFASVSSNNAGKWLVLSRNTNTGAIGSYYVVTDYLLAPVFSNATNALTSGSGNVIDSSIAFDGSRFLFMMQAQTTSLSVGRVFNFLSNNVSGFIGITSQAIANGATGKVNPQGGVATSQVTSPSAEVGGEAVFETAISLSAVSTFDSTNNRIIVAYMDQGNSNYGTAVVGKITGTTIEFGTPVPFVNASIGNLVYNPAITFDSNAGKAIIAFADGSNNNYWTAVVATVNPSDDSITYGAFEVIESAAAATHIAIGFDTSSNKCLVIYGDSSNSNHTTGRVGTVSGTDITFGTKNAVINGNGGNTSVAFDSNVNKFAVFYKDPASPYYGKCKVATISGTTVTYGSEGQYAATVAAIPQSTFDSTANKIVVAFEDQSNNNYSSASVGTISGTNITFGSSSVIFNGVPQSYFNHSIVYDSNQNKNMYFLRDAIGGDTGKIYTGTVSGTAITFVFEINFNADADVANVTATYDSAAQKIGLMYTDADNSNYGTGVVYIPSGATAPFVIGSTYYVQNDGNLSTTSSSVTAGKAISTTQLILNGAS